jgi:hypothetical protein
VLAGLDEAQGREAKLLAEAVELLLAGGVQLLSLGELLRIVASLYSSKAAADARSLRSHEQPLSLWSYVLRQLTGPPGDADTSGGGGGSSSSEAAIALAQLLGSAQAHVDANKEVAAFEAALIDSIPHSVAVAAGLVSDRKGSRPGSSGGCDNGNTTPNGSAGQVSIFRSTWGEVRKLSKQHWRSLSYRSVALPRHSHKKELCCFDEVTAAGRINCLTVFPCA